MSSEAVSRSIRALLEQYGVPGAAVSVMKEGQPLYRECFGVKSVDRPEPVTDTSTFDIGSISKTFNAATAALLVDEGKLGFDDRAVDLLPGFQLSDPSLTPHVTLRDLLGQSVGFGEDSITNYASRFTRAEIVDQIRYLPLHAAFRRECAYQQFGPVAAAVIVERLSGMRWEDFVEQRVCAPLGLKQTWASYFRMPDPSIACDPHMDLGDGRMTAVPHRNFDNLGPTGAMVASLRDMETWFSAFAMGGAGLLRPETVEEMLVPGVPVRRDGIHPQRWYSRFEANFVSYGIGFYAHDFAGRRVNEHTGALEGFLVLGCAVPSEKLAVVVLTNQHGCQALHPIRYHLLAHGLGLPQQDFDARYRAVAKAARRAPQMRGGEPYFWRPLDRIAGSGPSLPLADYAGDYHHPGFGRLPVRLDGQGLTIDLVGNLCDALPWHREVFHAVPRDRPLAVVRPDLFFRFEPDAHGRLTRLVVPGMGVFHRRD